MNPYRVGILGATGLVGQRLIERLQAHAWFEIAALAASEQSAGRIYGETVRWRLAGDPPAAAAAQTLRRCRVDELGDCDLVFSALGADAARAIEPAFARAGLAVVSNSSAFRRGADVPLVIPEVNAAHLDLLQRQRERQGGGYIVTNPNCTATGLAIVAAPLHRAFGIRRMVVTTLQALSGAGLGGAGALDFVDNVVPYIPGEESKIEGETRKILGTLGQGTIEEAPIDISAHCHRVATTDGHLEAVSLELAGEADADSVAAALRSFDGDEASRELPSAQRPLIEVLDQPDRPQPRLDRNRGGGMSVVVGRIRPCLALGHKLELLSHNTVRGAAGGALLNAELLAARALLPRRVPA